MMMINWKEVRHRMLELGIRSDAELARRAGIHPNTFGSDGGFRSDTVDRIASHLECHPFDIILVSDAPPPAAPAAPPAHGTAAAPTREQPPAAKSLDAALERQRLGFVLTVEERTLIRDAKARGLA